MNQEKPEWYEQIAPEPFTRPMFSDSLAREVKAMASNRRWKRRGGMRVGRYAAIGAAALLTIGILLFRYIDMPNLLPEKAKSALADPGSGDDSDVGSVGDRMGRSAVDYVRSRLHQGQTIRQLTDIVGSRYQVISQVVATEQGSSQQKAGSKLLSGGTYRFDFGIYAGYAPKGPDKATWYDWNGLMSGKLAGSLLVKLDGNRVHYVSFAYGIPENYVVSLDDLTDIPSVEDLPSSAITAELNSDDDAEDLFTASLSWKLGVEYAAKDFPDRLKGIRMFDQERGWAIGMSLWTTEDGGEHWTKRAPGLDFTMVSLQAEAFTFLDAKRAWYVNRNPLTESRMPTLVVYRTVDGGKEWASSDLPIDGGWEMYADPRITFLDESHGWVLLTDSHASVEDQSKNKSLYLTTDGGATWVKSGQGTGSSDSLTDTTGTPNGLVFRTPEEGYVTARGTGVPLIFRTMDGGRTWSRYALTESDVLGEITPPQFFGKDRKNGILALCQYGQTIFYHTSDGGKTWSAVPSDIVLSSSNPERLLFVDEDNGFVLGEGNAIRRTKDGGRTWLDSYVSIIGDAPTLSFISPEMGWASSDSSLLGLTHGGLAKKTYWQR
ncbi:WD40/YVTN/BNR-like repeat-containing protein [Gorillibacterium timonense]|uniref:WD40/YVTN/BNR-like repeat-containing protein n=1 Tax=Gorillibacterium timonense TaxID=1689269 RepID=UPI00071E2C2B|nr:YCF48-related protein [Gorillibacterium timonense]